MRKTLLVLAGAAPAVVGGTPALVEDVSAPAILSWFESTYRTQEQRAADVFRAGYGAVWMPPPGRADSGNHSVGYDQYDRFDLGGPRNPTLYGTETGLKATVDALHRAAIDVHIDFVANHNGFNDRSTPDFEAAGGYPGFFMQTPGDPNGDFHPPNATGDRDGRLSGLIDIDHSKNHRAVRNPVPGFNNVPAGTTPRFGRLANVPTESNRRFYPDRNGQPIVVFDPATGEQNIPIYSFNRQNPMAGDPVEENATGYLMRNMQWLVQEVGVDGFRLDAVKHFEPWVMNYLDRAVYRSSFRTNLDGTQKQVFSYSEVFDGNKGFVQSYIRKDINPNDPGRVGGNRDVLDFPQFFALRDNLSANGFGNDWRNVVNAGMDVNDDGRHNGSQGVLFVASHDEFGPYLSNVAHAYALMQPGNAVVYFNGKEHGNGRDFPKDGRGDALGGQYGERITKLVEIRNTHGRGNYRERLLEKEVFAFEREGAALVLLNNRLDGGFDSRSMDVNLPGGTYMVELTGNASNSFIDPFDDIPEVIQVTGDSRVNVRIPRNVAANGNIHNSGYLVYGLATPQGTLTLNGVSRVIAGEVPTPETNGSARLSEIHVVHNDSIGVLLQTNAVRLLGTVRDRDADGDNAVIRLDGGVNLNDNGRVDYTTPGSVVYGFEEFVSHRSPGYFNADGNGAYNQVIRTSELSEGFHFIEARAFRRRGDGGPAVYSTFKKTIYVDLLLPESGVDRFTRNSGGGGGEITVRSLDQTADNVHVFFDLPPDMTAAEIDAMLGPGSQTDRIDRDLWAKTFADLTSGNHAATVVTFEITGTRNIQRFGGFSITDGAGAGLADADFDGLYEPADVDVLADILIDGARLFNPACDMNGDAYITWADAPMFRQQLVDVGAGGDILAAYDAAFANVPEPAAAAMLLMGGGVLLLRRRRHAANARAL